MKIAEGIVDLTKDFAQPSHAVFAAWSNEEAQRSWGDPGDGWWMTFDQFRFSVGEADICRFGPEAGEEYVNENRYLAIKAGKCVLYSTSLSSKGRLNFAGTVLVTFEDSDGGTRLRLIEQGLYFDGLDDVAGHRSGWDAMLGALARHLDQRSEI